MMIKIKVKIIMWNLGDPSQAFTYLQSLGDFESVHATYLTFFGQDERMT